MDHVTFVPTPDQLDYTFGGAEPVLRIKPGTVLTLWTEDAFGGRITSRDDVASVALDTEDLNPQTGPFWIEGAEPGDTLAIHLVDLTPARSWGASTLIPFFGGLTSVPASPTLQDRAARTHLDLRIRLGRKAHWRSPRRAATSRWRCRPTRCSAPSASRRRAARCAARWCPTCSAATWTPPRWPRAPPVICGSTCRGAVLPGRRALPPGRGRILRHRGRRRHERHRYRRADQGRRPGVAAAGNRHPSDVRSGRAARWRRRGGPARSR